MLTKARRDFWERSTVSAAGITVPGFHALHGRSRTLPSSRLHRLRHADGVGNGTGDRSEPAAHDVGGQQGRLQGLGETLRQLPGVDLVASFGATLHVSGKDGGLLKPADLHGSGLQMTAVSASLEDAFIYLMQG